MTPRHLPPAIGRLINLITWTENVLLIIMLALMVLLAATQILLRNFFHTSIHGADDLLRLLVLWVAFLGAVAASREGKHIHVDAIARWLPGRSKPAVHAVTDLFTVGVCSVLAWESLRYVLTSRTSGELAFGALPVWVAASILPLAFTLIGLRYLLRLIHDIRQAIGAEAAE
jgi:TRAP-type C4-dicarboxylate transport system permease small subunit